MDRLVLDIHFLSGRVYAGGPGPRLTWPPEPGRLFMSMVHAWGTSGRDPREEQVLRKLEAYPPPVIFAPEIGDPIRYATYVPPNELRPGRADRELAIREELMVPILGAPRCKFLFEAPGFTEDEHAVLKGLLEKVSRYGSTRNPVVVDLVEEDEAEGLFAYEPVDEEGDVLLRTAYRGMLDDLIRRFEAGYQVRSTPSRWQAYARRQPDNRPHFVFHPSMRLSLSPQLPLEWWPLLAERLRSRLLGIGGLLFGRRFIPDWLEGHGHVDHIAIVPLPFVGDQWADGRISGVAFLVPRSCQRRALEGMIRVVARLIGQRMHFNGYALHFEAPRQGVRTLEPERWVRSSSLWVSVTPVLWDRHPKRNLSRSDEVVQRMAEYAGLPPVRRYCVTSFSPLKGVPWIKDFNRTGRWQNVFASHLVLEFEREIPGPVLMGRGRHFGMGLFLPVFDPKIQELL